jgi:hypothetical protein
MLRQRPTTAAPAVQGFAEWLPGVKRLVPALAAVFFFFGSSAAYICIFDRLGKQRLREHQ